MDDKIQALYMRLTQEDREKVHLKIQELLAQQDSLTNAKSKLQVSDNTHRVLQLLLIDKHQSAPPSC